MENNPIKILAFGMIAEKIKTPQLFVNNVYNTTQLKAWLEGNYSELNGLKFSIAVNKKIIQTETPLNGGDEVALLPPFSGG
ncbi:MAG: MoaD/ThiS family protein [Bacteroidia bacterium]|nr:MoaD/ThiS family protein [Bacteroidia bacterium]